MLQPYTEQFLDQIPFTRHVEPDEHNLAQSYKLVPTTHWWNNNEFPYRVRQDLKSQTFRRKIIQGLEYYMVPENNAKVPYVRLGLEEPVPEHAFEDPSVNKYMAADPKIKRVTRKIGKS